MQTLYKCLFPQLVHSEFGTVCQASLTTSLLAHVQNVFLFIHFNLDLLHPRLPPQHTVPHSSPTTFVHSRPCMEVVGALERVTYADTNRPPSRSTYASGCVVRHIISAEIDYLAAQRYLGPGDETRVYWLSRSYSYNSKYIDEKFSFTRIAGS